MNISAERGDNVKPHWYVLGAGAMGSLWAANLRVANYDVTLLGKNKTPSKHEKPTSADPIKAVTQTQSSWQQKRTATLSLSKSFDPEFKGQKVDVFFTTPDTLDNETIACLVIATKSTSILAAVDDVVDKLAQNATVICLANGMGYHTLLHEKLNETRKNVRLYCAVTSDGSMLQSKIVGKKTQAFKILHTGLGQTQVGQLNDMTESKNTPHSMLDSGNDQAPIGSLLEAFLDNGMKIELTASIAPFLWRKFFVNCAINPLTALFRCRNGELLSNSRYKTQLVDLCRELDQLFSTLDVDRIDPAVSRQFSRPESTGDKAPVKISSARNANLTTVRSLAEKVALDTAKNQSSMLTDILENRPTELRYLNQYAQSIAEQKNVNCPINDSLIKKLIALDTHHSTKTIEP